MRKYEDEDGKQGHDRTKRRNRREEMKPGRKIEAAKERPAGQGRIRVKNEMGKVYSVPTRYK